MRSARTSNSCSNGELLALHLPLDAVDVLRHGRRPRPRCPAAAVRARATRTSLDVVLAVGAPLVERGGDALVVVRLEVAEREVLEFPLQLPDAEPVGERREHLAGLQRRGALRRGGRARGAQACELDGDARDDQPRVADDRQQHLAQRLGLRLPAAAGEAPADAACRTRRGAAVPRRTLRGSASEQWALSSVSAQASPAQRLERQCRRGRAIAPITIARFGAGRRRSSAASTPRSQRRRARQQRLRSARDSARAWFHGMRARGACARWGFRLSYVRPFRAVQSAANSWPIPGPSPSSGAIARVARYSSTAIMGVPCPRSAAVRVIAQAAGAVDARLRAASAPARSRWSRARGACRRGQSLRVLGIDPGSRITGFGIIDCAAATSTS